MPATSAIMRRWRSSARRSAECIPTPIGPSLHGRCNTSAWTNLCFWSTARPSRRRAWAAWNYLIPEGAAANASVTYYLNSLQGLTTPTDYFVTLNSDDRIRPAIEKRLQTVLDHGRYIAGPEIDELEELLADKKGERA